jgi:hypothetical protein
MQQSICASRTPRRPRLRLFFDIPSPSTFTPRRTDSPVCREGRHHPEVSCTKGGNNGDSSLAPPRLSTSPLTTETPTPLPTRRQIGNSATCGPTPSPQRSPCCFPKSPFPPRLSTRSLTTEMPTPLPTRWQIGNFATCGPTCSPTRGRPNRLSSPISANAIHQC